MAKKKLKFKVDIDKEQLRKTINSAVSIVVPEVMNDVENDIKQIFNDAIDEYYNYPTRMYIRHGQDKPYTRSGENLYSAVSVWYRHSGHMHYLDMDLDHTKLLPYNDGRTNVRKIILGKEIYKSIPGESTDIVLNMITSGYRKRVAGSSGPARWYLPGFNSAYFELNGQTLNDIQQEIRQQFEDKVSTVMAIKIFEKIRGELFE